MALPIRRARPSDAAALTALIYASKQSNGYDDAFMALCADELRITPADIETAEIWVAETDHPVGCITLKPEGATGKIASFFVAPQNKRQGVGKALWQHILQEARALKLSHLTLDADPEAEAFYHAMGFETIGVIPSGSIPGRMLPLMRRAV